MEDASEGTDGSGGTDGPEGTDGLDGTGRAGPAGDATDWARWKEIDTLFESLLDLDPDAREEALDRAAPDPEVRRAVLRLLQATGEPHDTGPILPPRAAADALEALAERQLPETIGPFRPLRELGSGGMGTVYLAERNEGDFRQQVAVKVLRRGLDTDDLLARFRAERRILAGLRHPNVAHLVDGGSTSDGRPWLAMEYVEGMPLDAYCASRNLDERARVQLVRDVSVAVREVHRNLVVHRDIKPSNVLVTPQGVAKLLDFGIAKLVSGSEELDDAGTEALGDAPGDDSEDAGEDVNDRTRAGHRMLTPQYAAPEQRAGRPVTTATDVYQLGYLLRAILEGKGAEDPRAPGIRGDLRRVVAMAMHDDPLRRYRDAGALVEELDRWLAGRPVVARPDTLVYRTTRYLQRNRWAAPAGVVGVVLLAGWGWSLASGAEALRAERDRAQAAAERAQHRAGARRERHRLPGGALPFGRPLGWRARRHAERTHAPDPGSRADSRGRGGGSGGGRPAPGDAERGGVRPRHDERDLRVVRRRHHPRSPGSRGIIRRGGQPP
jgi:eukaryotic-like serine/threonine-protein kinase